MCLVSGKSRVDPITAFPDPQFKLNTHCMCSLGRGAQTKTPFLQGAGVPLKYSYGNSRRLGAQILAEYGASSLGGPRAENVLCPFLVTESNLEQISHGHQRDRIFWGSLSRSISDKHTQSDVWLCLRDPSKTIRWEPFSQTKEILRTNKMLLC